MSASPTPAETPEAAGVRRAGFLAPAPLDEQVRRMFDSDLSLQGYVANLTRVWAHGPESLAALSWVLRQATDTADLDPRERTVLVTATAAALGDSYCSLAFGSKLAAAAGTEAAVGVVFGDDRTLTPREHTLATWARSVVRDPSATTPAQVETLRAAGFTDRQVFAVTLFIALRVAFSTVNDALGAAPDEELMARVPHELRVAVGFGRRPDAGS
jgi:alkylhydroperoxidase family enzyme